MRKQKQLNSLCIDGRCPVGIDSLKKIGLTPKEKRAVYFGLKEEIFKQKQLLKNLPLF
jgi:hypothetical protein